jgi:autotransporter family porin
VVADRSTVDALPVNAQSVSLGADGIGLLDLNGNGGATQRLVVSDEDGGRFSVGDVASGLLRVDEYAIEAQGTGNTIRIGDFDAGLALFEYGATLSTVDLRVGENARGEMILTGGGTKATVSSTNGQTSWGDNSYVVIGRQADSYGKLTVADGALLEVLTPDGANVGGGINLGVETDAFGELIVDDASVRVRDTDGIVDSRQGEYGDGPYLNIGRGGEGRMELRDESELTLQAASTRLLIGDGDQSPDAEGVLNIDGDSTFRMITAEENTRVSAEFLNEHYVAVGRDGGVGEINITDGGLLEMIGRNDASALVIGAQRVDDAPAGTGTIQVSGPGSRLEVRNENSDGKRGIIIVGDEGEGSLVVDTGASAKSEVVLVGDDAGSKGDLLVTGAESSVLIEGLGILNRINDKVGGFLVVGQFDGSEGSARISEGASMTISKDGGIYTGMQIGNNAGSTGVVTVEGEGSELLIRSNGELLSWQTAFAQVGRFGSGTLNILDGGRVVNDALGVFGVGTEANGSGKVTVSGANSLFDAGGLLLISGNSEADLIDRSALDLSGGGKAEVVVGQDGTLRAGDAQGDGLDDIFIGENGTLRIEDGGVVEGDVNNTAGGTYITGNSPGWARIVGDFNWSGELEMEFSGSGRGEYDRLDISGEAILAGLITLDFSLDAGVKVGDQFTVIEADEGLDLAATDIAVVGLAAGLDVQTRVTETALEVELI